MNARLQPTDFVIVTPTTRERIDNIVEDLLLLLDEFDGDPDLEPTMGLVPEGYQDEAEGDDADAEVDDTGIADCAGSMNNSGPDLPH